MPKGNASDYLLDYRGDSLPLLERLLDTELTYVMNLVSKWDGPVIGSNAFIV